MSTDQPACLTCGHDATLTVAWIWADRIQDPFVPGLRAWYGIPRPSCDFCADEDEVNLPRLTHGPRVIGLHRAALTERTTS